MAFQNYIAEGFLEDCEELIHSLTERYETVDWQKFCACWKEMEFDMLFYGRQSSPEVVEFTEEVLQVARLYLVTETDNFEDQVIGLFIAYAITLIQPYKNLCSLRLVPKDVPALKKIEAMARRDNRRDILVILGKMYLNGKVQFHLFERERAMDISLRKYYDGSVHVPMSIARRWRGRLDRNKVRELDHLAQAEARYMDLKRKSKKAAEQAFPGTSVKLDTFKSDAKRIADSLRKLMSSGGVRKEDDGESYKNMVKQRAMKKTVDSMRHLNSVADRKMETPAKSPTKSPKPSASKGRTRKSSKLLLSPLFYISPTRKTQEELYKDKEGFSLPSLDDPPETEPRKMDREGSPEVPFKGFSKEDIRTCDYNIIGAKQGKGKGKSTKQPVDQKRKSPRSCGKRKLNFTEQAKNKRKPKNKLNKKLKLNDFDSGDSDEGQTETFQGKELTLQSKGVIKHFVEFEVDDIVIRTEKDAPQKDIEIEYIDNYTDANALYEEICELSDEEEKSRPKVNTEKDDVVVSIEECDEFGETNDDNMEIFDVVSETNLDRSRMKNSTQSYNAEVDDTMHKILSKTTRGVDRRKCKQPNLRSKLKKLGILPVANFGDN